MQPPYSVLVVGCGNIGAGYDLHSDAVLTHAKAFHRDERFRLTVTDNDPARAQEIGAHYGVPVLADLSDGNLAAFDAVALCVPTHLHFDYLAQLIRIGTPLIVCEKPVVATLDELARVEALIQPTTRLLVNYTRRFQPGMAVLRQRVQQFRQEGERLQHITVRYTRGLLNNAGHALDLMLFLFGALPQTPWINICTSAFDVFPNDPTATLQVPLWDGAPVTFLGFPDSGYSIFEIDIFNTNRRIALTESGSTIRYFRSTGPGGTLAEEEGLRQDGVLKDHMIPVADAVADCLQNESAPNFADAIAVNRMLLEIIALIPS